MAKLRKSEFVTEGLVNKTETFGVREQVLNAMSSDSFESGFVFKGDVLEY